jgi:hypothetical protein
LIKKFIKNKRKNNKEKTYMLVDEMEEFDIMKAPQILEHLELDKSACNCYQRLKHVSNKKQIICSHNDNQL